MTLIIRNTATGGTAFTAESAPGFDHQAVARQALTESGWVDPQRVRDFQAKEAK